MERDGTPETTLTVSMTGSLRASDSTPTTYTTTSTFDARHRLLTTVGPRTDVNQTVTRMYYADNDAILNRRGRPASETNEIGLTTTFDNYDVYGTAGLMSDPNGVQTVAQTDARGRVVLTTNTAVAGDPLETSDYTSTSTFDGRDRLVRSTRPRGNATTYAYEDGTNRLTDTVRLDASGNEVERRHLTLNSIGDKIREEDQQCAAPAAPCASWITKRQEDFVYDVHNRLARVVHAVPSGATVAYGYDSAGLLKSVQDENHATPNTIYGYDELNRLASVQQTLNGSTITTSYRYDAEDNLISVTNPNSNTTTYAYDDFHRMQTQTSPVTGTTSYSYDAAGNLASITDANGATTTRTYDAANRLQTAASTKSGVASDSISYTYDDPTPARLSF